MIEVSTADIDFYQGKIKTLQEDNFYMHQEIVKLRTRLRTAEDFEIKYSLLVSANQRQMERLRANFQRQEQEKTKELLSKKLKQKDEYWLAQLNISQTKLKNESEVTIEALKKYLAAKARQLSDFKTKSEEAELFGFKVSKLEKENQNLRTQLEEMRSFHDKLRAEQIAKLRTVLGNNYKQKLESQKKKYETKIQELQKRLTESQLKDDNVTFKASQATNRQLVSLKALLEQKSNQYAKELQQKRYLSTAKNELISKNLKQRIELDERYRSQIQGLKQYIKQLEDKLLQIQKLHEIQLINLLQRTKATKDQQKQELTEQINHLKSEISRFQQLWNERIRNHEQQIEKLHQKFDEEKRKFTQDKNLNKRKISQLSLRIKEAQGRREIGDTQMLINSQRDIDVKGDQLGSYQNGITFLQRLNKKCQLKLQQKSRIVNKLYKDINDIRAQAYKYIQELKEKIRNNKKEHNEKVHYLENQIRDLSDKLRANEKQLKKNRRQFQKQKTEFQQRCNALKQLNDQLQRDYNRVISGKKDVEASYREQRQKSFASKSDLNSVKKQKWLQLQNQKNELHIIFKEKQEQIKLGFEQPLDDLKNQLNKLKQDYQLVKQENYYLKKENKKVYEQLQSNKQNDKIAEYNKKMATLNIQLALTQNIYESLKKAKSRIQPSSFSPAQFSVDFDEKSDIDESLVMTFHPSARSSATK